MALQNYGTPDAGFAGIFVGRPILAIVINLLVIIAGLAALTSVEVRELPNVDQPTISIRTSYPGASPRTVVADVTRVLEDALSQLQGLKTISSTSIYGNSTITLELNPSVEIENAANDARELVAAARNKLPEDLDDPVIRKSDANADPIMRLSLSGNVPLADLTTLAEGPVSDRITAIDGVAEAEIGGAQERIFRVTFNPVKMASRGLSISELRDAVSSSNLDKPLGALETGTQALIVRSVASTLTAEAISRIRIDRNTVVGDVAYVQLTSDRPTSISRVNGQPAVVLSVIRQSLGNTLAISKRVRAEVDEIQKSLPDDVVLTITADDGVFIERSLSGVVTSIFLAIAIVIGVIFLFLRSLRAIAVPAVAVPIALIGSIAAIWISGFSINTITLLALILATGMVVDDAIVVLENIVRKR